MRQKEERAVLEAQVNEELRLKGIYFDMIASYETRIKHMESALLNLCTTAKVETVQGLKEFIEASMES
jgi:uncharacterized protein YutD